MHIHSARAPLLTARTHLQRESHEQNQHITHYAREKKKKNNIKTWTRTMKKTKTTTQKKTRLYATQAKAVYLV